MIAGSNGWKDKNYKDLGVLIAEYESALSIPI